MLVVGVDGGSTKTVALVADEQGQVIGAARGGGSNWAGEDVSIPMGVVAETVRQALAQAGALCEDVAVGFFPWPARTGRKTMSTARRCLNRPGLPGGLLSRMTRSADCGPGRTSRTAWCSLPGAG